VKVKILEIDSERRRLSLSVKRVDEQGLPPRGDGSPGAEIGGADLSNVPELGLSDEVFSGAEAEASDDQDAEPPATDDEGSPAEQEEDPSAPGESEGVPDAEPPSAAEQPAE